jgi:hypothetical protein
MSDSAVVQLTHNGNLQLVATNPGQMEQCQGALIQWCQQKMELVKADLADAEENLAIAKKNKWRHAPWQRRVSLAKAKLTFYDKVEKAVEAGYYIVPAFPVDVFAIRTDRDRPNSARSRSAWETFKQNPRLLPAGEGAYVSDLPEVWRHAHPYIDSKTGEEKESVTFTPGEFEDVEFPMTLVKPQVLDATAKAMARKIFDQIGVLPNRRAKGDPILVGQIIPPHRRHEPLTFFISWWLNTNDL